MSVTAVVGATWGDEGKGKITDALAETAHVVVRFQGGRNAGHTIINDHGRFALHLLPSGVFTAGAINILGPGVAVDLEALFAELDELLAAGVPSPDLRVAHRAQVVLPVHVLQDRYEEERLGAEHAFGSTRAGIAPFYGDKYMKIGVQVGDLFDEAWLSERVSRCLTARNVLFRHLYAQPEADVDAVVGALLTHAKRLEPMLCDASALLHERLAAHETILAEGQLGALRDPDHGIYPYSSSSSPLAGYIPVGAGVPAAAVTDVVAVAKAYSSCVGAGPFVTEWSGTQAEELRQRGGDRGEYGATTGRPRRVGPFDGVATRYGCRLQGATRVALTNLDVLSYLEEIPVCRAYRIAGRPTRELPLTRYLEKAEPVFDRLLGWPGQDLTHARRWQDLPDAARRYVDYIEDLVDVPVQMISVGPHRDALIYRD
jgi:adenylosuccinate synthase